MSKVHCDKFISKEEHSSRPLEKGCRPFNPCYGLQEIKRDLQNIQGTTCNIYWQTQQISEQTTAIENEITDPNYGLRAIKRQLNDPMNGLQAIQEEITALTAEVSSPVYGLSQLQTQLNTLQETVEYLVQLIES